MEGIPRNVRGARRVGASDVRTTWWVFVPGTGTPGARPSSDAETSVVVQVLGFSRPCASACIAVSGGAHSADQRTCARKNLAQCEETSPKLNGFVNMTFVATGLQLLRSGDTDSTMRCPMAAFTETDELLLFF